MQILTEIVDSSHELLNELKEIEFFKSNPFIDETAFLNIIQIEMQRKWEMEGDMELTDDEIISITNSIIMTEISDTLSVMVDTGDVKMSINNGGEFVYQLNNNKDEIR